EKPPAGEVAPPPPGAPVPARPEWDDRDGESEVGVYDLLAAFKDVLKQRPRIPVHEVEIDEVTIEDRMQHVEAELVGAGRILFEDLFGNDPRRMAKVVTFMALLELCKLDRIVIRQNRALGAIWVYPKQAADAGSAEDRAQELEALDAAEALDAHAAAEGAEDGIKPGLVAWVQEQILQRKARTALDQILADLERELREEGGEAPDAGAGIADQAIASLAAATLEEGGPEELAAGLDGDEDA